MGIVLSCFETFFSHFFPTTPVFERAKKAKKYIQLHVKCRNNCEATKMYYQSNIDQARGGLIERCMISDENVPWCVEWPNYNPIDFTDSKVLKQPVWADPIDFKDLKWNQIDGSTDRRSHMGIYKLDSNGRPLNPIGRTGITGRGQLGKWGPNHAADPIVTKWKRNENGEVVRDDLSGKRILQFVSIERHDTHQWAIPGGMCDPGEKVSMTLKREFMEEAANSTQKTEEEKKQVEAELDAIFSKGSEIYRGYVDDPRNTDNSWMETIAYNFHDEDGTLLKKFKLEAGDDARKVKWMDIDSTLKLYASHRDFIQKTVEKHDAHW